jgi:hypothetical protein
MRTHNSGMTYNLIMQQKAEAFDLRSIQYKYTWLPELRSMLMEE